MKRYSLVPVVIVATLVVSSVAVGASVATGPVETPATATDGTFAVSEHENESVPPADAVYVSDNGDVVVEYNATDTEYSQAQLSGDLSEGLLYAFAETMEDDELSDLTGNASMHLRPAAFVMNGDLTTPKPDDVTNLSVRADGALTREEAYADMLFDVAVPSDDETAGQFIESLSSTGTYEVTGEGFSTSSSYTAEYSENPVGSEMSHEFTLAETDSGFTVEGDQSFPLPASQAQMFATEEDARETLSLFATMGASELGGEASVDLQEYAYDDSGSEPRVDIAYTVTVDGVKDGLMQSIATGLAADNPDISQADAEEIVSEADEFGLSELAASVTVGETTAEAEWSLSMTGYDALVDAAASYAEQAETPPQTAASIEQLQTQLDIQQETGVETRASWDATVAFGPEETTVSGEGSYTTDNWAAYVSALEEEGMGLDGETEFNLSVTDTETGELYSEAAFTVRQEAFVDGIVQSMQTEESNGQEAQQVVQALERADFELISANASIADRAVTIEAGAEMNNGTALQSAIETVYGDDFGVEQFYAGTDTDAMHVHVNGAVDDPTSEQAVRELAYVGEETTVFLPSEWDEESQSFGQAETDNAVEFLDAAIDNNADGEDDASGSDGGGDDAFGPGFGVGVALVVIALFAGGRYYSQR